MQFPKAVDLAAQSTVRRRAMNLGYDALSSFSGRWLDLFWLPGVRLINDDQCSFWLKAGAVGNAGSS